MTQDILNNPNTDAALPDPSGSTRSRAHEGATDEAMIRLPAQDFAPAQKGDLSQRLSRPSLSYWQDAWLRLKKNKQALTSLLIVLGLLGFTLAGPLFWNVDPAEQDMSRISETPSLGKQVVVLPELQPYQEIIRQDAPETPAQAVDAQKLAAPGNLELMEIPSTQAVRLKWEPVPGASGYMVYRSQGHEPTDHTHLGVPLAEVTGGNRLSYEDTFNLVPGTYVYSVVAKNGEESPQFSVKKVELSFGVPLEQARMQRPDAQPGDSVKLRAHPFGTDYLGRDLLARLIYGARVSLFIGFFAPLLATLIGILMGGVSGYLGGRVDHWLMRFTDFVLALPFLLFMILIKVTFGLGAGDSGIAVMLFAMVALSWVSTARLVRGQVLQLRETEFVQASRLLGARPLYLILRHLLPNTLGVVLVSVTFAIPQAIFTEAFLSFIGMGVVPPTASWGSMCNDGIQTFLTSPHEFIFPAALISVTVLAFNLLGDGLRDALDPRMRSVQ